MRKKSYVSEYITPEQAQRIIDTCPDCKKWGNIRVSEDRDRLILRTMWETGGRVAEVLSLISYNIDLDDRCIYLPNLKQEAIKKEKDETAEQYHKRKLDIHIQRKQRKEMVRAKGAPLLDGHDPPLKKVFLFPGSTLCQDLLLYADGNGIGDHEWIFQGNSKDNRVSTTYIWYLLSSIKTSYSSIKWKRKDGIATSLDIVKTKGDSRKPAWPHLFRHGAAMNIYHNTGRLDVTQLQLGHSTIQATEGYAKMTDEDRKSIIQKS